jgi:tRNA 2-(methylsulfanyl)-N6-isopentenyladenosine37 hydroxylase
MMLHLAKPTPARWLPSVQNRLDLLLVDHAHCEKKAAGTAMNLLFAYVEDQELCKEMTEIVREELEHFHMVLDILNRRGIKFKKLSPSTYGRKLSDFIRKDEPNKAVDRLLVAGLIEARSCERFGILRDCLDDKELSDFFGGLFESEARHHSAYVRLAKRFQSEEKVEARLKELAEAEAAILESSEDEPRMHS